MRSRYDDYDRRRDGKDRYSKRRNSRDRSVERRSPSHRRSSRDRYDRNRSRSVDRKRRLSRSRERDSQTARRRERSPEPITQTMKSDALREEKRQKEQVNGGDSRQITVNPKALQNMLHSINNHDPNLPSSPITPANDATVAPSSPVVSDFDESELAEVDAFLEGTGEPTEEELIEERRKRRAAILAAHATDEAPREPSPVANIVTDIDALAEEHNEHNAPRDPSPVTFDIFSSSPAALPVVGKVALKTALVEGENPHLQSNWDDQEGYYKTRIGELINNRYRILGDSGKGVFSTVLKCTDLETESTVVIKVIRNNDIMRKAAEKEITILKTLRDADVENRRHIVRLLDHLEYRSHIVMVFEALSMNLRDTLKKFGKNVGINIIAVKLYARQLFIALKHLSDHRVIHADIKPDNILVSEDLKQVKICDLGSAFFEYDTDNDPTPYLVSRFYRAPEIILGLPYEKPIDMWSIGCCLFELFTGHILFPGKTNNEMLKLMMECKGRLSNRIVKLHIRAYETMQLAPHFDSDMKFKLTENDIVTGLYSFAKYYLTLV